MTGVHLKAVPGYARYIIGTDGSIWSVRRKGWRRLQCRPRQDGYIRVSLHCDGNRKEEYLHRIILLTFRGPCPEGKQTRHLNGKSWDCSLKNLVWGTPRENAEDRRKHGTIWGHRRRLTVPEVLDIRQRAAQQVPYSTIAATRGVSARTVSNIVSGVTWKHLLPQKQATHAKKRKAARKRPNACTAPRACSPGRRARRVPRVGRPAV